MKRGLKKVSIVECDSYAQAKVDKAVVKALELAEIEIPRGKKVLIKPNIVHSCPENKKVSTTNPVIIRAICKILKSKKCKIYVGESSFMNTDEAFISSGIDNVIQEFKAKKIIFEQDNLKKIKDSSAKVLKEFHVAKTLKEVDLIINVPKLKTHKLTKFTGAIKNLYGVIPGGMKQKFHLKAQNEKKFSSLLIDIYQNVKPEVNIMDGVIGMEGEGPTGGKTKKAGYILACSSSIELDVASSKLIGFKPINIFVIKEAVKRKLGKYKFELVGMKKLPKINFKKPVVHEATYRKVKRLFTQRPIVCDKTKCIKCGMCASRCPAKAIILKPYPFIDKKKCIRCFCCMEVCPKGALSLKGDKKKGK